MRQNAVRDSTCTNELRVVVISVCDDPPTSDIWNGQRTRDDKLKSIRTKPDGCQYSLRIKQLARQTIIVSVAHMRLTAGLMWAMIQRRAKENKRWPVRELREVMIDVLVVIFMKLRCVVGRVPPTAYPAGNASLFGRKIACWEMRTRWYMISSQTPPVVACSCSWPKDYHRSRSTWCNEPGALPDQHRFADILVVLHCQSGSQLAEPNWCRAC